MNSFESEFLDEGEFLFTPKKGKKENLIPNTN